MDNIHIVKETTVTFERKSLVLVHPYLDSISLQTRTKLRKLLKNILNCYEFQIVFKNKTGLCNNFHFKNGFSKVLLLVSLISFNVDSAILLIMLNVLDTCINHLPKNKLSLRTAPYFSILTLKNKKFLLELKQRLLIIIDQPSLNRNIASTHCTYLAGPSNKIVLRILFAFNS